MYYMPNNLSSKLAHEDKQVKRVASRIDHNFIIIVLPPN